MSDFAVDAQLFHGLPEAASPAKDLFSCTGSQIINTGHVNSTALVDEVRCPWQHVTEIVQDLCLSSGKAPSN